MSEINNTGMNNVNNNVNFSGKKKGKENIPASNSSEQASKNINELRNDPHEFLGRTQVKFNHTTSFEGSCDDNLKKDLEIFQKNPDLIAKSNLFFEKAMKSSSKSNEAYAKAATLQKVFVKEFLK